MLKKAVVVVTGNALGSILLLVRNLIVARMVSPENYGIASTFAISMSIVEMLSYLGLNQLMIVDKNGDDPHFQAAMQGFQVLRGCFSSIALFLIARPFAIFMGFEQVTWAYQLLAVAPFINGFQHYDTHRLRRHMNFTPTALANCVPPLISVLSVWPIARLLDDYRIMLVALFVQAGSMVVLSHLTAKRPYRLTLDFDLMRKATVFGWPILVNGALIFGVLNGEKLIVGRELGVVQFAFFTMAFTLTVTPTLVLANSCQSLFLPPLTAARESSERFQRLAIATMEAGLVIAVLLVLGSNLIGGPLIHLMTGPKYVSILAIIVPMAVLHALRVAKTGSDIVALAIGQTSNSMVGNLVRVASMPLSWWAAVTTGDVLSIIWIGCAAELIGYILTMYLAARRAKIGLATLTLPIGLSGLTCIAALWDVHFHPPQPGLVDHLHLSLLAVAVIGIAALVSMSGIRQFALARWRKGA